MVIEMLDTGELIVRRPKEHIEFLMKIRRGEMEYDDLLKMAEEKISSLEQKYENSELPEKIDIEYVRNILLNMRKKYYNLQ
jgi:CRISPR/Cas system-associated endonuclease Cas3-HD